MENLKHKDYERVKRMVTARDKNGYPIPCWFHGPPGAGKTMIVDTLALECGVPIYYVICSDLTTDNRVLGWMSPTGEYIKGFAYDWFEGGGFLFFNEIDNIAEAGGVALNSVISSNRYMFPNGKVLVKHKDCYAIADANTLGLGAQGGFRRKSQDSAFRNRWGKAKVTYDATLEATLSWIPEWTDYVRRVRDCVGRLAKTNVWITPRDVIIGSSWLQNGVSVDDCLDHLFCELSDEARMQVVNQVGIFKWPKPQPRAYRGDVEPPPLTPTPTPLLKPAWQAPSSDLSTEPAWNPQNPYRKVSKKIQGYD